MIKRKINRVGKKYGRLTVTSEAPRNKHNQVMWNCQCDCNNALIVSGGNLSSGHSMSCGCLAKENRAKANTKRSNIKDKIGQKYGKLTIIKLDGIENKRAFWEAKCVCGNTITKRADAFGKHSSCGCSPYRATTDVTNQRFGRLIALDSTNLKDSSGAIEWVCQCDCGNKMLTTSSRLKNGTTKSCGCLQKESIQKQGFKNLGELNGMYGRIREKHPSWKGGREEGDIERKSTNYKKWRLSVFKRDLFTCQKCKKKGASLQAHHLESFAIHIDIRYDINNGVTLCKKCHQDFHLNFGRIGFNKKDFQTHVK